ncbi:hypothetical protein DPMN_158379 [Dreissena polymorpha]|uniref:Uncharacterized protein n=1 Tax=Dreissena polymorpha TaxID=45954 RepID=A0A9D4IPR0_DREPO|nr:hypothetical protein DPMN_158379 [Dreissena polymorpha]
MFCISSDGTHNHFFVAKIQEKIKSHLDSIGYKTDTLIEFTDGFSVQYKCTTCMGRSSLVCGAMGYKVFQRNNFETSLTKEPQNATGGLLKGQPDLVVFKGKHHSKCSGCLLIRSGTRACTEERNIPEECSSTFPTLIDPKITYSRLLRTTDKFTS